MKKRSGRKSQLSVRFLFENVRGQLRIVRLIENQINSIQATELKQTMTENLEHSGTLASPVGFVVP